MQILKGIAVSPGVAIGEAMIIDNEGFRIPRRFVARDAVEDELSRLDAAISSVANSIEENRRAVTEQLGEKYGAIFSAQLQMLRDQHLHDELEERIRIRHNSPEYAVSRILRRYAKVFQSLESTQHAELASDIFDIEKRLLHNLLGLRREELSHLTSPVIVLANTLTPSETANLNRQYVLGFATEEGGRGGHTSIVAEALELPAVVGTGRFLTDVSGGELVIVDGDNGQVILRPDEETIARFRHELEEHHALAKRLTKLRDLPSETTDGHLIDLFANIEFPSEVEACQSRGADGIGLYRTEFLYLGTGKMPNEEDHYNAYVKVACAMGERPVVIRTVDLGADKLDPEHDRPRQRNPFLGLRSLRLSLRNPQLFRTQLRAVLRASTLGNIKLMFPLVSTLVELRQAKAIVNEVREELDSEGIEFSHNIPIGMMVEVPATVITLDAFLDEVDFLSLGTNDLIQYTLAVDRSNHDVATLYDAGNPAVLRLIDMTVKVAQQGSIPVTLCGQMSGDTTYTMLLLGLGLRSLSVAPSAIPEIKKICRSVDISQCEALAQQALELEIASDVNNLLKSELKRILPELALFA